MKKQSMFHSKSFEIISFVILIAIMNLPLAYAINQDVQKISSNYTYLLTTIPLFYGLSLLLVPNSVYFTCLLFGTLIGYLTYILTWFLTMNPTMLSLLMLGGGIKFYNYGLILPIIPTIFLLFKKTKWDKAHWFNILTQLVIFLFIIVYLIFDIYSWNKSDHIFNALFGFIVGFILASVLLFLAKRYLISNIAVLEKINAYIFAMIKPMIAFFAGYVIILFFFVGMYSIVHTFNPEAFEKLSDDVFLSLFYFSLSCLTGLGAALVQPKVPISILIAGSENFLGLIWITVVFAASIGYLQSSFNKISDRFKDVSKKTKEKK